MTTIDREYFDSLPDSEMEAKPIEVESIEAGMRESFSRFCWFLWGTLVGMVLGFSVVACAAWIGGA